MNFIEQFPAFQRRENGIYYSIQRREVSFPADGYDKYFQLEDSSFWFRHRNQVIAAAVKKYSPDRLFLDVGGGNGYVAKGLEDHGITTVLLEPGEEGALNARRRGLSNVICSSLEEADFPPGSIPGAGAFDVVEHIEDDLAFLRKLHTILSPGGLAYIAVPAFNLLWSNEDVDVGHYRRYSLRQIRRALQATGFEIVYATYFFSILPLPIFVFRTLPSFFGFNRNSYEQDKLEKEHAVKNRLPEQLLDKVWQWELAKIRSGGFIPVGSSCLIIGRKPAN